MKKFVEIISILLCAAFLLAPFSYGTETAPDLFPTEESVLNVSPISEEQAELCAAVMLDGFEADETERKAAEGTLSSVSLSALEGEKCLCLTGNDTAETTLTLTKKRSTANARSLCVCAYVEPVENAEFLMTVTLYGTEKTVYGASYIPAGQWCAAYLPINTETAVNIKSIKINISAESAVSVRVTCLIDRVHTATVDGLPDKLRYFASDFTANRGEIAYTDDALIFSPSGSNSYIESSLCGYMTGGKYNALAFEISNDSDAENMILRLKLDRQYSFTEENSHTLQLRPGEHVYSFPIGGFRSGATVEALRLEFPGDVSGVIAIKSISFSSFRFPAEYGGKDITAEITDGRIVISGKLPDYPASSQRICLYRLTPGFDEEEPGEFDEQPYAVKEGASSSFGFEIPVKDGKYDNSYFKYLIRYETETGYEDAGVAYVNASYTVKPSVAYKGAAAAGYTSVLTYLMPGTVYADADLGRLLSDDADVKFSFAGITGRISSSELEKYDELVGRCVSEGVSVVLRFVYSPFPDSEKYYFVTETSALPDLTTAEGAAHYMALLSFFAERYGDKISAFIPCGALDSAEIAEKRGFSSDQTEKYASDVIFAAKSVLEPYGIAVAAPVGAKDAPFFLSMLGQDITEPDGQLVFIEADSADEAEELYKKAEEIPFDVIMSCRVNDTAELARLYYGCRDMSGICARGLSKTDERAELFSLLDTTAGVAAADRLASDGFPDGVTAVYPDIVKEKKEYNNKGELQPTELPQMITALYDGTAADGWTNYDCCKSIYTDTVNGETAAGLAFDYTSDVFGYAAFCPEDVKFYDTVYFRLYADYLPEDVSDVKLRIFAESDNGITAGYCTVKAETATVIPMQLDLTSGRIKRFTVAPLDMPEGSTPRICVFGIYTYEKNSSETLTEAQTETMPEPETQVFDTAPVTQASDGEGGSARLYIISIFVIISMFTLCGAVIYILKRRDQRAEKKQDNEKPS